MFADVNLICIEDVTVSQSHAPQLPLLLQPTSHRHVGETRPQSERQHLSCRNKANSSSVFTPFNTLVSPTLSNRSSVHRGQSPCISALVFASAATTDPEIKPDNTCKNVVKEKKEKTKHKAEEEEEEKKCRG